MCVWTGWRRRKADTETEEGGHRPPLDESRELDGWVLTDDQTADDMLVRQRFTQEALGCWITGLHRAWAASFGR